MNITTYFVLNCNVLALLSFYALPSGGNRKTRWSKKDSTKFKYTHFELIRRKLTDIHLKVTRASSEWSFKERSPEGKSFWEKVTLPFPSLSLFLSRPSKTIFPFIVIFFKLTFFRNERTRDGASERTKADKSWKPFIH